MKLQRVAEKVSHYRLWVLALVIIAGASACDKEPQKILISQELKNWFVYNPGSYWIMRDSATNQADSIVCTGWKSTFSVNGVYDNESIHIGFTEFDSSTLASLGGWRITLTKDNPSSGKSFDIAYLDYFGPKGEVKFSPLFTDPYVEYRYPINDTQQHFGLSFLPQLTVHNRSFDSVYDFNYSYSQRPEIEHWYVNRGQGFLKIVLNNAISRRTLVLERWQVSHP